MTFDAVELFDEEIGVIPEDVTEMSDEELRAAHSYWVGSLNFSSNNLAKIRRRVKELKRVRDVRFKVLFLQFKQNQRQSNEVARYRAELESVVQDADNFINRLELEEIRWEALVEQCDKFRSLLSREQSWREKDRDMYYHGRGGQGR